MIDFLAHPPDWFLVLCLMGSYGLALYTFVFHGE
jgi:hypothetical protein